MKSILGIGNALTDILAVLPDDTLLRKYHLPLGSMQHVDMETGDRIWEALKEYGVKYVPGGSAANTVTCTAIFGMPSGYIGKIGNDDLGNLYKSTLEQYGVHTQMLFGTKSSGRCMVFITGANAERTFADYMGATRGPMRNAPSPTTWAPPWNWVRTTSNPPCSRGMITSTSRATSCRTRN